MEEIKNILQKHFLTMCSTGKLFITSVNNDLIWETYIKGFSLENNPKFRDPESSSLNCNLCKNFIRRYGNIIAIDSNNKIITLFDAKVTERYQNSFKELSKLIKKAPVQDIFFETFNELNKLPYESCLKSNELFQLGIHKNVKRYTKEEAEKFGVVKANELRTFHHLHIFLPKEFVDQSNKSIESIRADYRTDKEVFKRAMDEISLDTLNLVRDLIQQGSLLNGDAHLYKIEQFIPLKKEYDELAAKDRDNWCWLKSYKLPFAKWLL